MTDDAEWYAWHNAGIGGSDVAGILNISPYTSALAVYAEKVDGIRTFHGNEYTEFGKRAEPMLAQWFEDTTGLYVVEQQAQCAHPAQAWQRCTLDGVVSESPTGYVDALGVWEAKTDGPGGWDEIPAHIQAQCQWQMHVTGLDHAWITALHGRTFALYELDANPDDQQLIVSEVDRFWHEHILAKVPPDPDGSELTAKVLRQLYPQHTPAATVEIPADLYDKLSLARDHHRQWTEVRRHYENRLTALMGDAELATVDGQPAATWRTQTARRIDTTALANELPDIADKYRTETTSRVLRVTDPKQEDL